MNWSRHLAFATKFNILRENELWQKKRTKQIKNQSLVNFERREKKTTQNVKSRRIASVEKLMKEDPMNNVTNPQQRDNNNNNSWIFLFLVCSLPVSNVFELQKVSNVFSMFDIRCMRVFSHFYGFLQSEKKKLNYFLKFIEMRIAKKNEKRGKNAVSFSYLMKLFLIKHCFRQTIITGCHNQLELYVYIKNIYDGIVCIYNTSRHRYDGEMSFSIKISKQFIPSMETNFEIKIVKETRRSTKQFPSPDIRTSFYFFLCQ